MLLSRRSPFGLHYLRPFSSLTNAGKLIDEIKNLNPKKMVFTSYKEGTVLEIGKKVERLNFENSEEINKLVGVASDLSSAVFRNLCAIPKNEVCVFWEKVWKFSEPQLCSLQSRSLTSLGLSAAHLKKFKEFKKIFSVLEGRQLNEQDVSLLIGEVSKGWRGVGEGEARRMGGKLLLRFEEILLSSEGNMTTRGFSSFLNSLSKISPPLLPSRSLQVKSLHFLSSSLHSLKPEEFALALSAMVKIGFSDLEPLLESKKTQEKCEGWMGNGGFSCQGAALVVDAFSKVGVNPEIFCELFIKNFPRLFDENVRNKHGKVKNLCAQELMLSLNALSRLQQRNLNFLKWSKKTVFMLAEQENFEDSQFCANACLALARLDFLSPSDLLSLVERWGGGRGGEEVDERHVGQICFASSIALPPVFSEKTPEKMAIFSNILEEMSTKKLNISAKLRLQILTFLSANSSTTRDLLFHFSCINTLKFLKEVVSELDPSELPPPESSPFHSEVESSLKQVMDERGRGGGVTSEAPVPPYVVDLLVWR